MIAEDIHTAVHEGIIPSPDEFEYRNKWNLPLAMKQRAESLHLECIKNAVFMT